MPETPLRVLAVDDNEIHCYSLGKLLTAAGFEVSRAHSGKEALEAFRELHPNAVLLDIGMGDMDGYEVCAAIRSDANNNDVAIVFHSATHHVGGTSISTGADACLTYPVDSLHFISVLRGCIQRRLDTHVPFREGKKAGSDR